MKFTFFHVLGCVLLFTLLICIFAPTPVQGEKTQKEKEQIKEKERFDKLIDEGRQKKYREKFCRNQERTNKGLKYQRICIEFNRNQLKFIFSLFIIISVGAVIRTLLRVFEINLPYTVILMIFGILVGLGSRNDYLCTTWTMYTWIARTPPQIILFVFLPVLIYESAFSMKAHVFYRSAISILVLALPGMIITTFITAGICMVFFFDYHWSFTVASLYGSIISATDPVAVVAILKEIGASETLSIMIEGESLLNDGVAILLYEIFDEIVKNPDPGDGQGVKIFRMFCRITIGGPAFGWLMAKLSIAFLSRIFNDAPVEVSITLVAAYLTYYIAEAFLEVSGVMAVVALGIVMSAERTCISPEVQGLVHHFWEMLGYLGNTVLFVIVGIVISETAINTVTLEDGYYLIFLYFALNIARFLMIIVLSPLLSRMGYGLSWQNMMVMTWGGLRGAVGICLSLEVFKDRELCDQVNIGPKFLLQTAGIVLLTLFFNGTTTKSLLDMLKLTELSIGKIQDMANAVKQVEAAQQRTLSILKHDRFLSDSNWDVVKENTTLENPYLKQNVKAKKKGNQEALDNKSLLVDLPEDRHATCPKCEEDVDLEPSIDEYRELTEEARLRLMKAMKVSFWRQFEQGVLTEEAVQILVDYLENCEDKRYQMFHSNDLQRYWEVKGMVASVRDIVLPYTIKQAANIIPPPTQQYRICLYEVAISNWFNVLTQIIVLLNMIPIFWETIYIMSDHVFTHSELLGFLITNCVFALFYIVEFIAKMIGFGLRNYCSSKWNILDASVLCVTLAETVLSINYYEDSLREAKSMTDSSETDMLKFLRFVRLLRVARVLRLFQPIVPHIMIYLNCKINVLIFLGYDVGKGMATAIEDVGKFLPQMIENQKILNRFKVVLEEQRLNLVLEMGLLQKGHPGIAIAVKTRHANRGVLNQMRGALIEIKEDGLVDDKEFDLLMNEIESKMKRLWDSPPYMPPPAPEMVLANLQWVGGDTELLGYLLKKATLLHFVVGDVIYTEGDDPNGIFVIVSGIVKIHYEPNYDVLKARDEFGIIPNMEIFGESTFEEALNDYFSCGAIIGDMGLITESKRAASVSCETGIVAYHLSQSTMRKAMEAFNDRHDSLEGRIWRSYGMRLASTILPNQPAFQSWTMDKIKSHLELSAVPIGDQYLEMTIPEFITDVILVYGQVVDADNEGVIFTAPVILPRSVDSIKQRDGNPIKPKILVIASEEMDKEKGTGESSDSPSSDSIQQCVISATKRNNIIEEEITKLRRQSVTLNFGVQSRQTPKDKSNIPNGDIPDSSDTKV